MPDANRPCLYLNSKPSILQQKLNSLRHAYDNKLRPPSVLFGDMGHKLLAQSILQRAKITTTYDKKGFHHQLVVSPKKKKLQRELASSQLEPLDKKSKVKERMILICLHKTFNACKDICFLRRYEPKTIDAVACENASCIGAHHYVAFPIQEQRMDIPFRHSSATNLLQMEKIAPIFEKETSTRSREKMLEKIRKKTDEHYLKMYKKVFNTHVRKGVLRREIQKFSAHQRLDVIKYVILCKHMPLADHDRLSLAKYVFFNENDERKKYAEVLKGIDKLHM